MLKTMNFPFSSRFGLLSNKRRPKFVCRLRQHCFCLLQKGERQRGWFFFLHLHCNSII
jgi:hypothetical protein